MPLAQQELSNLPSSRSDAAEERTRARLPRTPRRGTGAGSSEPDPAEPGGLVFGRFGPGLVSAPLVPVFPPVGIDVPQEGAGFAEDFGVYAWVVFLDLKEGQKQGPE